MYAEKNLLFYNKKKSNDRISWHKNHVTNIF